jgi:Spy/CpxP family protein refolding chaperone
MKIVNALAIALATALTASAHAATLQDAQAPRSTVVPAPRGDERVEAPRDQGQDIQAPRGHETQSPR